MKKLSALTLSFCLLAGLAQANVKLVNRDSQSYDLDVTCSSSAQTSVGGSSTRDLGTGPCTVKIRSTGAGTTAQDGQTITIQNGSMTTQ